MKKLFAFLLVLQMLCTPAFAAEVTVPETVSTGTEQTEVQPRAEQTKWYYRVNNGVLEKRLWSLTYGYWKTDWEPV